MAATTGSRRAEPAAGPPTTQGTWLTAATRHLHDDQVALVLATGSTGTAHWRGTWSDLDVLVVRDSVPLDWLRRTVGTLPAPEETKVGVSTFTTGDIAALRVPPRVVHALRRAARGIGVLYRRADYGIPVPTSAHADSASRGELGLVVMTMRRLLAAQATDVRAVYKHLALLAKILARAEDHHVEDAETVLAAFSERHRAADCSPPALADLIRRPHDPRVYSQLTEASERMLTYLDRLDQTVRPNA